MFQKNCDGPIGLTHCGKKKKENWVHHLINTTNNKLAQVYNGSISLG
jgi:hypothetical protein